MSHSHHPFQKICFFADKTPFAQEICSQFLKTHLSSPLNEADVIVVLGGDGFMLRVLHTLLKENRTTPVYGINCGTVGFLMNTFENPLLLEKRLETSHSIHLNPLYMETTTHAGTSEKIYAINEIALLRQTPQVAKISIYVNDVLQLDTLIGDGVLLSTPAGSTAYNFSAGGPILPLEANLLALTPINVFRPRRWHGALLPKTAHVRFEIQDPLSRPVSSTADFYNIPNVKSVKIQEDSLKTLTLLFDPEHNLERRILEEQFKG